MCILFKRTHTNISRSQVALTDSQFVMTIRQSSNCMRVDLIDIIELMDNQLRGVCEILFVVDSVVVN